MMGFPYVYMGFQHEAVVAQEPGQAAQRGQREYAERAAACVRT